MKKLKKKRKLRYQTGGPIITNDPNDSRLKKYKDSLQLFNYGVDRYKSLVGELRASEKTPINLPPKPFDKYERNLNESTSYRVKNDIKPVGFQQTSVEGQVDSDGNPYIWSTPLYKKPVQPVVYQPKQVVKPKSQIQDTAPQRKPYRMSSTVTFDNGGPIVDPQGQWKYPGSVTKINSNNITMKNVNYPVYGKPNKGPGQMMYPNQDYVFPMADSVVEYPLMMTGKQAVNKNMMDEGGSTRKQFPDEISFPEQRKNDFLKFLRETSFDVIQDDLNGEQQQFDDYMKKGGGFKLNPDHKGWCSPMTKSTCTGKRRQFAINAKNHFKKQQDGGELPEAQYGQPVMNQYPGAYNPWYDYIPNVGKKSYKQHILNPMKTTMTDPNNIGTEDFPGKPQVGPLASQDTYNPMWTNEDLQARNQALDNSIDNVRRPGNQADLQQAKAINAIPPENYRSISSKTIRPPVADRWWANPDIINAGMEKATSFINNLPGGAQDRHKKWLKKTTTADWWNPLQQGNRGDYLTNNGQFRPDQTTPIQYPGNAGMYQYKSGGTYYITPEDEKKILALGGTVTYID